jgi:nitrite reductase (NO-forming)
MNMTHQLRIPSFASRAVAASALVGLALTAAPQIHACAACNLTFADEVTTGERADSIMAADLRRAMENQRAVNFEGYGDTALIEAQLAKLDAGETAVARLAAEPAPLVAERTARTVRPNASPAASRPVPPYMEGADFIEIIERDYALATRPTSFVPQDTPYDKTFTITLHEGKTYIGNGVVYEGFLMDGKVPGQTIIVDEGDVVEMIFENKGNIPHGASIHSAYTQTSKYVGSIGPMTSKSVRFRAMTPGVYMYHCAPGGHAIGMHVIGGQYGMMVVRPKPGSFRLEQELGHEPNLELFLLQHELYASGRDSIFGEAEYTLFNGRLFRYVEEPIMVKPGDYVRINFLNVGPNLLSTFHIVGIIWDYIYWQGHPEAMLPGGQTVTAGPSDSFVIEFRIPPDEGAYTMLSHAVGSTNRGAIGLLVADRAADVPAHRKILADGPGFTESEMDRYITGATRTISPFGIGTHPKDRPVIFGPETKEVHVSIIGNAFYPKVIQIAPGTKVTWTNEDAFTYLAGEYSGIHNAAAISAPEENDGFVSPLLAHGESWSHTFDDIEWTYDYICTPHPYMLGRVIVAEPEYALGAAGSARVSLGGWVLPLIGVCLVLSTASLAFRRKA